MALVWSTICERGGTAAGLTALLLVLYTVVPAAAPQLSAEVVRVWAGQTPWYGQLVLSTFGWVGESCLYLRLNRIMQTGFNEPVFSTQVVTNLAGAVASFGFAWLMFGPAMRRAETGGTSRGLVRRSAGRIRIFGPGRVWALPLAWKDFQFIAGGYVLLALKLFGYALVSVGLVVMHFVSGPTARWGDAGELLVICLGWAAVIEACVLSARIFHDEVRLQTLSSLLMLPRSIPYLAYSKALGCLLGLAPSIGSLCLGLLFVTRFDLARAGKALMNPTVSGAVMSVLIFLHLVALLSLFVRWGALPLAIVVMTPLMMCCPIGQLLLLVAGRGGSHDPMGALAATVTVAIMMGLVCFVFQMMIAARLQEIGAKN
jgi:hypothetical protein